MKSHSKNNLNCKINYLNIFNNKICINSKIKMKINKILLANNKLLMNKINKILKYQSNNKILNIELSNFLNKTLKN